MIKENKKETDFTTITLPNWVKDKLDTLKVHERQAYYEVIIFLLEETGEEG